ncbi:hypothetical protein ILYODFUR_030342 [Ilyodon furcidens]|uniref:Uncharacterized protein n=1 Tax=Ilyodon furcidens TaxID=33524 RepID=A0ABV0V982_9TELE
MPDMNTALPAQERNDINSCWYSQQSMCNRKRSKVWLSFQNMMQITLADVKCLSNGGITSNLWKHLVKQKIFLNGEECTIFISLTSMATAPAFGSVSMPASVSDSSSAISNMGEEMFETTEMLQYK